jgi:hypothetical protein
MDPTDKETYIPLLDANIAAMHDMAQSPKIFVSHRWITPEHPDPDGAQLRELQMRLSTLAESASIEDALVFYDYCSMVQNPFTDKDHEEFNSDLRSLQALAAVSSAMIILSEGYNDYINRMWCFYEMAIAGGINRYTGDSRLIYFDDQDNIKRDTGFMRSMFPEPASLEGAIQGIMTSDHLSYKPNYVEFESVITAFQHLSFCRTTKPEDAPLIKSELVHYFNSREMSAFGRLLTALAKFFDLSAVVSGTNGAFICKPFFEEPEWVRPPTPNPDRLSNLAVPDQIYRALLARGHSTLRLLRLTIPGVEDFKEFLQPYQKDPKWKDFVVPAAHTVSPYHASLDCFPTIDHVIHTFLERPPGFILGPQCLYLPAY